MTNPTTILTLLLLTITTHRATSAHHLLLDEVAVPPSDAPLTTPTEPTTTPPAAPTTPITTTLSAPPAPATDAPAPLLTFFMHDVLLISPNQATTASTTTKGGLFDGAMTVIDDDLIGSAELGSSTVVGKAQGFCAGSVEEGTSKTVAFTAMFGERGHYADSLIFFGVQRMVGKEEESRVAVMGGTGKYVGAKGYATVLAVVTSGGGENVTDGVGTLLQFSVYFAY